MSEHDHEHGAAHEHHHAHLHSAAGKTLLLALALTPGFSVVELIAGWRSGSLALLADAGHMVTDGASLGISALAAWLLTLHPTAAGRVYAAYGGAYIFVAILWLWAVDGSRLTTWDVVGSLVALAGMGIIMFGPRKV